MASLAAQRPAAVRAFIGLGSNLRDPAAQVRQAVGELERLPGTLSLRCSPLYRSAPLGPPGQPDYVNAVSELRTTSAPFVLLGRLQEIEGRHGRVRGERWGPRTLDLDLLLYDELCLEESSLTLPHPRLHERAFVLVPLRDLAPELRIPGRGRVEELIARVSTSDLLRLAE